MKVKNDFIFQQKIFAIISKLFFMRNFVFIAFTFFRFLFPFLPPPLKTLHHGFCRQVFFLYPVHLHKEYH